MSKKKRNGGLAEMGVEKVAVPMNAEPAKHEKVELCEGLVIENRARIRTIRKMEKYFKLPSPKFGDIDFSYLDNMVPMIFFLAQQIDPAITEGMVEDLLDNCDMEETSKRLQEAFEVNLKNP